MSHHDKAEDHGVPNNDEPTGAGAESPEEGQSAMDDADDAVVDKSPEESNSSE